MPKLITGLATQSAGIVNIGTLDVLATQSGLLIPRMTMAQRNALASPQEGLMIYNTTKRDLQAYRSTKWENVGTPAGVVMAWAGSTAPDGWLLCDGNPWSRSNAGPYFDLWVALGTTSSPWGLGDGSGTFNVPNFQGRFLRGAGTSGIYSGTLAQVQGDAFAAHKHSLLVYPSNGSTNELPSNHFANTASGGFSVLDKALGAAGSGTETRPANVGVNYIIKI